MTAIKTFPREVWRAMTDEERGEELRCFADSIRASGRVEIRCESWLQWVKRRIRRGNAKSRRQATHEGA